MLERILNTYFIWHVVSTVSEWQHAYILSTGPRRKFCLAGWHAEILQMPNIPCPVSSLTFNQSSKRAGDYPGRFQSEHVRWQRICQCLSSSSDWASLGRWTCGSSVWLINISLCALSALLPNNYAQPTIRCETPVTMELGVCICTNIRLNQWITVSKMKSARLGGWCKHNPCLENELSKTKPHSYVLYYLFLLVAKRTA